MSPNDLARSAPDTCQCRQQAEAAAASHSETVIDVSANSLTTSVARTIDVSNLPPPLPMVRILETLRELGPGQTLLVQHTRRPIHLYPKLEALGCTHETTEQPSGRIEVRITKPTASSS